MTQEQYINELQAVALNAINALRITGCADKRADDLAEKLESLAEPPPSIAAVPELLQLAELVAGDVEQDDEGSEGHWEDGLFYPQPPPLVKKAREILANFAIRNRG